MCRTCREVLSSLSNEEKLTEISEEKLSPIVVANYDEEDFVTQIKKMTVVRRIVVRHPTEDTPCSL